MKAIGLLSGGLDSTLAVKLILEQGIEVIALKFTSPFCNCDHSGRCFAVEIARQFNITIHSISKGEDYLSIIRKPKHGYGSGINPCIDCRIFMLKKSKEYADKIGAAFIFTGEVAGQRPMSQKINTMKLIEKEAGLIGKIVRPLSAQLLEPSEAELNSWVNRSKLLNISGRSRKEQIALAEKSDIRDYPCPAGGCLLTDKIFAKKLRDFFEHNETVNFKDIRLLKTGRHFRFGANKIIVGRDEKENEILIAAKNEDDYIFHNENISGPTTILQGNKSDDAIKSAAELTAAYSNIENSDSCDIYYGDSIEKTHNIILVEIMPKENFKKFMIY